MTLNKSQKLITTSVVLYGLAFVWYFSFLEQFNLWYSSASSTLDKNVLNATLFGPWWLLTIVGVLFAFSSTKFHTSKRAVTILIIAEILIMLACILLYGFAEAVRG